MTQEQKVSELRLYFPELPEGLTVGGHLFLSETQIKGVVYDCGNKKRAVAAYNYPGKGRVVSLGCFIGTKEAAIAAIKAEYGTTKAGKEYIEKVKQAFDYKHETTTTN